MGPPAFLYPAIFVAFRGELMHLQNPEQPLRTDAPTRAEISFWPCEGRIEPALCLDLHLPIVSNGHYSGS
jgi:hypothetical protein